MYRPRCRARRVQQNENYLPAAATWRPFTSYPTAARGGYDSTIQLWGSSLTNDDDLLLYCCNSGACSYGQEFIGKAAISGFFLDPWTSQPSTTPRLPAGASPILGSRSSTPRGQASPAVMFPSSVRMIRVSGLGISMSRGSSEPLTHLERGARSSPWPPAGQAAGRADHGPRPEHLHLI